jgi:hypothetical protein
MYGKICKYKIFFVPLPKIYKSMAKQPNIDYSTRANNSAGQGIILVWKNKGETDPAKYEMFNRLSVMYQKYENGELGVLKGTLNNFFSRMSGEGNSPLMYENEFVRIIRTTLYTTAMFK